MVLLWSLGRPVRSMLRTLVNSAITVNLNCTIQFISLGLDRRLNLQLRVACNPASRLVTVTVTPQYPTHRDLPSACKRRPEAFSDQSARLYVNPPTLPLLAMCGLPSP